MVVGFGSCCKVGRSRWPLTLERALPTLIIDGVDVTTTRQKQSVMVIIYIIAETLMNSLRYEALTALQS